MRHPCFVWIQRIAVAVLCAASMSCGDVVRTGRAPVILVIDNLTGGNGAKSGEQSSTVESDVLTYVNATVNGQQVKVPTVFEDPGQVQMHTILKDEGTPGFPSSPTPLQAVTITRYHIAYKRADGRNTPGVDVPYAFDGAITFTVDSDGGTSGFTLVRVQAKLEAPLKALIGAGGGNVISTIAEVTFYGKDQAGNAISVTGWITVTFADWGDPA